MQTSFIKTSKKQQLESHINYLSGRGFKHLQNLEDRNYRLVDLYDTEKQAAIECKTDYSGFTDRLLIEYKANVPGHLLKEFEERQPIPHERLSSLVKSLPDRHNALATDTQNLQKIHFLSYFFRQTGKHCLLILRQLRRLIESRQYPWIIVGHKDERWRTIAVLVPLSECRLV